jgi:osmoprotectant transport system ATP-binding protein
VDGTGRVVGVASQQTIGEAIRSAHAAGADDPATDAVGSAGATGPATPAAGADEPVTDAKAAR